jgi:Uma2 family endonuclease
MTLPRELLPSYTYEDYKNWEGRWEFIEGIPFALASPTFLYQRVVAKLIRFIDEALEEGCENCALVPDTDYIVNEQTVLRPDVAVVCNNEGVEYYVLVYPEWKKVKIYRLKWNKYLKLKDLSVESLTFSFESCTFSLDFKKIWEV